ncbi:MAG: DUF1003 domain-containing protein [Patescibacteria group bacterium]
MNGRRRASERLADFLTNAFGTIGFFLLNTLFFVVWIGWNSDIVPGVVAFDPYPYGMLTMVVSLEAIFLSIFVLISQNRAAKVADLREEIDLQINIEAEQEITQMLKMLERIEKKLSVKEKDVVRLAKMEEVLDLEELERKVARDLAR